MTAEELYALPENDRIDRRLINGRLVERPYPFRCPAHATVVANLAGLLLGWRDRSDGTLSAFGYGCPYRLRRSPDTLLTFDSSFVERSVKLATPKRASFVDGLPTFAVEVIDLSDPQDAVLEMVDVALSCGVPAFWLINPFDETVCVYRPGGSATLFSPPDDLGGDPELPGFRCRVAEIFE